MAYPNAGLPNDLGEYDEAAAETAAQVREWAQTGLVNIVGGCCGTTPAHIAAISEAARTSTPRAVPAARPGLTRLAPVGTLLGGSPAAANPSCSQTDAKWAASCSAESPVVPMTCGLW